MTEQESTTVPMTTEQARVLATGWAMLRDYDQRLAAFRLDGRGGFPMMADRPPSCAEFDQLFAWVLALLATAAASHDSHEPVEEAQAAALIDAIGSMDPWVGDLMDAALAEAPAIDEYIRLQWRNDWGVNYLAHESWGGSADSRAQRARFGETVTFVTGDGCLETGSVVMLPVSSTYRDHGRQETARFEVPTIEWSVHGTTVQVDPATVRILRSSLLDLPLPDEAGS